MAPTDKPFDPAEPMANADGFDILDGCHRQTLFTLGKLAALMSRLDRHGADEDARNLAREVHLYFSTTARQHHEDEERHVFPALREAADADLLQTIDRLQQDHHWLHADWMELAPQLDAVANGQSWWEIDILRDCSVIFAALSHEHIALEESIIYPQARKRIASAGKGEMHREMAARRAAARASKVG